MADPSKQASEKQAAEEDAKKEAKTAFVVVKGVNIDDPLDARSYARDENGTGCPSLYKALQLANITQKIQGSSQGSTTLLGQYVLPNDSVLLMIGNTEELLAACRIANAAPTYPPCVKRIETENARTLELRYARILVSKGVFGKGAQTDTLIALGQNLPAVSEKGWHEATKFSISAHYVTTTEQKKDDVHSLPAQIRYIKKNDGNWWIDAHA